MPSLSDLLDLFVEDPENKRRNLLSSLASTPSPSNPFLANPSGEATEPLRFLSPPASRPVANQDPFITARIASAQSGAPDDLLARFSANPVAQARIQQAFSGGNVPSQEDLLSLFSANPEAQARLRAGFNTGSVNTLAVPEGQGRLVGLPFLGPEHGFDPLTGDTFRLTQTGQRIHTGNIETFAPVDQQAARLLASAQNPTAPTPTGRERGSTGGGTLAGLIGPGVSPQDLINAIQQRAGSVRLVPRPSGGLLKRFGGGIGGVLGGLIGALLAPETGGLSLAIPALGAAGGTAAGQLASTGRINPLQVALAGGTAGLLRGAQNILGGGSSILGTAPTIGGTGATATSLSDLLRSSSTIPTAAGDIPSLLSPVQALALNDFVNTPTIGGTGQAATSLSDLVRSTPTLSNTVSSALSAPTAAIPASAGTVVPSLPATQGLFNQPISLLGGLTGKEALGAGAVIGGLGLGAAPLLGKGPTPPKIDTAEIENLINRGFTAPPAPSGEEAAGIESLIPGFTARLQQQDQIIEQLLGFARNLPPFDPSAVDAQANKIINAELTELSQSKSKAVAQINEEANRLGTNPAGRLAEIDRSSLLAEQQIRARAFPQALALLVAQQQASINRLGPFVQIAQLLDPTQALLGFRGQELGLRGQDLSLAQQERNAQLQTALALLQLQSSLGLARFQGTTQGLGGLAGALAGLGTTLLTPRPTISLLGSLAA